MLDTRESGVKPAAGSTLELDFSSVTAGEAVVLDVAVTVKLGVDRKVCVYTLSEAPITR